MNRKYTYVVLGSVALLISSFTASAIERTANANKIDKIIDWAKDGVTTKITFPAGLYLFTEPLVITNDGLTLVGNSKTSTILKLTTMQNTLIDAKGNNAVITDLTLNGANKQGTFGHTIFNFNKSEGHRFERVLFKKSLQFGIGAPIGWATDGLTVSDCEFSEIKNEAINVINRNTIKRGELITSIDQIIVEDTTFRTGYKFGIHIDSGNDRTHDTGTEAAKNRTGRRYTQGISLNNSVFRDNTFETTTKFHIAGVQATDYKIVRNTFAGMTNDADGGSNSLHFEQFTKNVEIYDNTFSMADTVLKSYPYILISATEGHKRLTQSKASSTYKTWTFNVDGGPERRAKVNCADEGNTKKNCKRDVHAYGPENIYIAGNTFNSSAKVSKYITMKEGENIQIGTKKNGDVNLNSFNGGTNTTQKIQFGGNDEGTCDVKILAGQNIVAGNVQTLDVNFELDPCALAKPIVIQ
jgi:hypothetical protein